MSVRNSVRIPSETCPAKRPKCSVRYYYVVKAALSETQKRISDAPRSGLGGLRAHRGMKATGGTHQLTPSA